MLIVFASVYRLLKLKFLKSNCNNKNNIEDNIYEYDTNKTGDDEIIENIIKNIERLKNENINVRKK